MKTKPDMSTAIGPRTSIVVYSMNYSEGLVRARPSVQYFYERALSQLARLADPQARVIIVTPEPINGAILDYHVHQIFGLNGAARREAMQRVVFLTPQSSEGVALADAVFNDKRLVSELYNERAVAEDALLVNFAACPTIERLGSALGIAVEERPYELAARWGSKSGSKTVFARVGVPAPPGPLDVLHSTDHVATAACELARASGARRVVVKLDDAGWGSGLGIAIIDTHLLRQTRSLRRSVMQILQPWEDFAAEIRTGGAIIEEYVRNIDCAPCGQGYIERDGVVRFVSTHDQLMTDGELAGLVYPAPERWHSIIRRAVSAVGEILSADGARGTFGVDFISAEGRLFATEINLRKLGTTHVFDFVRSAFCAPLHQHALDDAQFHYVYHRIYRPDTMTGAQPRTLIDGLRRSGLLFDRRTGAGVVLHSLSSLAPHGCVDITCVGPSRTIAEDLRTRAMAVVCGDHGEDSPSPAFMTSSHSRADTGS
jgi:L-propargylglycine--L-glutamate ligase